MHEYLVNQSIDLSILNFRSQPVPGCKMYDKLQNSKPGTKTYTVKTRKTRYKSLDEFNLIVGHLTQVNPYIILHASFVRFDPKRCLNNCHFDIYKHILNKLQSMFSDMATQHGPKQCK